MKEKDLKIKRKQADIKIKEVKTKDIKQKYSPLKERMKVDCIRESNRKSSEKGTSEASNRAEETMEDAILQTAEYGMERAVWSGRSKTNQKLEKSGKGKEPEVVAQRGVVQKTEPFIVRQMEKVPNRMKYPKEQKLQTVFQRKFVMQKGKELKEHQQKEVKQAVDAVCYQEGRSIQKIETIEDIPFIRQRQIEKISVEIRDREKTGLQAEKRKLQQQYQKDGKRKSMKELRHRFFSQDAKSVMNAIRKEGVGNRIARTIANTAKVFVKGILVALGGLSGIITVFVIIGAVLALVSTAFGVFFSPFDDTTGTKKIAEIVAETNRDFYARVEELEEDIKHDMVKYHVVPDGGNQLFITNWPEVVAVFAAKTSGEEHGALDVVTIDDVRARLLQEVFWDMNKLTYRTEKIITGSGKNKKTKVILHITLTKRNYEEMANYYDFSLYQKQALEELMQPEYAQMLSELVGTLGVMGSNIELTPAQVEEMLRNLSEDLSPERRAVMEAAYSLVGKVNYFWGGKSEVIGWDGRWGMPQKVTAAGSNTTGMTLPFGLDCSGFVTWVFINAMGDPSYANVIGHGARNQYGKCRKISWKEARPGDLVFYPDLGHVGIVAGMNEKGELLVAHCAFSQNCVVVTGVQGFTKIGRPVLYEE